MSHPPPTSKILSFRRAKMVVKCTSAEQFTGLSASSELLLLKRRSQTKKSRRTTSDIFPHPKFSEDTSLSIGVETVMRNTSIIFVEKTNILGQDYSET